MYVECFTNNGKPYLRLVQSVRVTNKDGKKIPQKQVVYNIGPLDRFDDGQPDYVQRLKKSFKAGVPLIPALEPYCQPGTPPQEYQFSIKEGSSDCFGHPRLFSHVLLERILEELGLNTFFSSYDLGVKSPPTKTTHPRPSQNNTQTSNLRPSSREVQGAITPYSGKNSALHPLPSPVAEKGD